VGKCRGESVEVRGERVMTRESVEKHVTASKAVSGRVLESTGQESVEEP
jgi:hypothetical protein